jgi:trans-aconitate methyltransferase
MATTDTVFTGSIPSIYDSCMVPLLFEPYAAVVAERARSLQPKRILETAAGTGAVTSALHAALPDAEIVATDLNQPMLDVAAARLPSDWAQFWSAFTTPFFCAEGVSGSFATAMNHLVLRLRPSTWSAR